MAIALLVLATPAGAEEPLAVVVLGPHELALPSMTRTGPGQLSIRPARNEALAGSPPALAVLVDGRARLLVDARSGTLGAARTAGLDLGQLSAVLLSSMRPAVTAELPELLADARGPSGTVRLVAPLDRAWPSPSRWAEALFGPAGLYPGPRAAPRSLRVQPVETKPGAERRVALQSGVELRARTRAAPTGTSIFRLTRGDAVLVLAGEVAPGDPGDLVGLGSGAGLLVASVPSRASVETLAGVARAARPRQLVVIAAGDEVRSSLEEARASLAGVAEVTWVSTARISVPPPRPASVGDEAPAGCRSDDDCGPGRLCMGCGDGPRECIKGCRSKADCPSGQACIQAQCIRCPCPAQCTGG